MWQQERLASTIANRSSGTETAAAEGDPVSSDDRLGSEIIKLPSRMPGEDETGDKLPSGVSEPLEPISDPIANKTDFGDWFSCSESDKFGDKELVECSAGDTSFLGE